MAKNDKTGSKNNKNNYLQTISFQNFMVYGLIIVAFIIFGYIWNSGMQSVVGMASSASTAEAELINEMSVLKTDAVHMSAEINRYMGALGEGTPVTDQDFAAFDGYVAELQEKVDYVCNNQMLTTQSANGATSAAALAETSAVFIENANKIKGFILAGDVGMAGMTIGTDYGTSLDAMNAAVADTDAEIMRLSSNLAPFLMGRMNQAARNAYIVLGVVIVFVIIAYAITYIRINKVILSISKEMQDIIENINKGKGDLTARINTKTKTELAMICDCINQFLSTLQGVIKDVKDGATVLSSSADSMVVKIQSASDNVTNTSAAMEELAASMQNVSATTAELNDKVLEVREASDAIDAEAKAGADKANEIKEAANAIKREATEKKDNTGAKMEELSKVLEESVKESEQVNQISDLTNEILDIASQTNLLALNASIEAARAGEAGKGFAVVADEISALAANSRDTAGNIQEISAKVTAAVKTLSDNAIQVIDFINENVLADYDAFVETGSKYEDTASMIDEMLETFSEKADNLNAVMNEMAGQIETISRSVEESSSAINMSAASATDIVGEIQGITEAMDQNNDVTKQLNTSTQKFEIV